MAVGLFPVVELAQRPRADGVLEVVNELVGAPAVLSAAATTAAAPLLLLILFLFFVLGIALGDLFGVILRRGDVELDGVRIDEADGCDRQVLAVVRVFRDAGELGGDPVVVEDRRLAAGGRIHQDEVGT